MILSSFAQKEKQRKKQAAKHFFLMAFRQNAKKNIKIYIYIYIYIFYHNILVFSEKYHQISKKKRLIFFHKIWILILIW